MESGGHMERLPFLYSTHAGGGYSWAVSLRKNKKEVIKSTLSFMISKIGLWLIIIVKVTKFWPLELNHFK
jgi:hypothetical protein